MAAPNIVGVTTVTGITTFVSLDSTNATNIVSNPVASGAVYKINTIIASNIDGTNTANITVKMHQEAAGAGSSVPIASTIDVVADSTLVILDKASALYLEENRSISATASAADDLAIICSYEEVSD
tara:strand:- start:46 stop:423 length:378 start_codon:yes stop_codon:yes gene_type:complete